MTRRRFFAPPEAFTADGSAATLSPEETQHLRNVLRLQTGDEIFVFDGAGHEFRGEISSLARDQASIRLFEEFAPSCGESPLNLKIAVALLKGEKFDLVIQKLAELGVNSVTPITTMRADVRIRNDEDAARKLTRWRRIALEAIKQCGRAREMIIEKPMSLEDFVARDQESGLRLMFAERGGNGLSEAFAASEQKPARVTALIGPEGGWSDGEIEHAREARWEIVTLGGRTMRAETAAIICAALLQHRFGDLV